MPTRFNYIPVPATSFSLTPAEILLADDTDLNEYVGLKKLAPYRKEKKGKGWDAKRGEKLKALRDSLRERGRVWRGTQDGGERRERNGDGGWAGRNGKGGEEEKKKKKRAGKKERKKAKGAAGAAEVEE
jgi:protein KRI1